MQYVARPYQQIITSHLLRLNRSAVWAGMGLGKTVATLTTLDGLYTAGEEHPTLVLAPLRVARTTWPEEAQKWSHLSHVDKVVPIIGTESERLKALHASSAVYATNYEQLPWLVAHYRDKWPYRTVVVDESTRLKSFRLRQGGIRAQAFARVAHTKVKRIIELTGTPSPNGLIDLWGQAWFIDAGVRLGRTFTSFVERWFRQGFDGYGLEPMPHAQAEIQERLRDVCLTIDAKDWFDLNDPITTNIGIDLPIRARQLYREMENQMFMDLEGHPVEAFNAAARTLKCLQIASGAAYVNDQGAWKLVHDEKINALQDIIEEANGAPVIVAYHFKSDLERLKKAFPRARQLDARPETIDAWNSGKISILLAHPASAGHGLNLQYGGNILVFFSHWWALEERLQIIERIGPVRQKQAGFDRPVFVYNIVARNTMDELVMDRVKTKRDVQDLLLEAMKQRR